MNNHAEQTKPRAKARPGVQRRVTSNEHKAKLAAGFIDVAKRMDEDRWK